MNIDDFILNNQPKSKKSIFDEHFEDIHRLINLGYSQKQVIEFLKTKCKNKTGLSEQNLSFYLKKSKKQKHIKIKQTKTLESSTKDNYDSSTEQDLLNFVNGLK
jgi:hypothetical protein